MWCNLENWLKLSKSKHTMEKQYFYQISGRNQKDSSVTMKKRLSNNSSVIVNNEREQWKKSIYRSDFVGKPVVQGYSILSP